MIPVTKTFLPELTEYTEYLQQIWENGWITNRGKLVKELESDLQTYLGVDKIIITNNGTIPLQIAIDALQLEGDIITTPFTYIATTAAILWQKCKPHFVDIDPRHLTIDECLIEKNITPNTSAILATHVFGNPCNVEALESISRNHGIPIIYDAAHCFGVKYDNQSVFNFGDISTCSFHATKIFHTGEGGAIFCKDQTLYETLFYKHNFGHKGPLEFHGLGINGKISELQAAMGLTILPYMPNIIQERKSICEAYREKLFNSPLQLLEVREKTEWNYSYFPIIFESEDQLLKAQALLNKEGIYPRRYFYPSLTTIDFIGSQEDTPVSNRIGECVMCLPLYIGLTSENIETITSIIKDSLN